jgi:dipeptidyl aminopeptidase/acylaminoacyl peptidase
VDGADRKASQCSARATPSERGRLLVRVPLVPRRLAPGFRIGSSFRARFSGDGRALATLGQRITLWDVAARERVAKGPPLENASSLDFAPDGRLLAAKNTRGEVLVMGVPDLDERARFSGRGFGEGTGIRFAPDGRHLVDGSWSGLLTVRDATNGEVVWQEAGDSIFELASTRDRRTWVYTRAAHRQPGQVLLREWPLGDGPTGPIPPTAGAGALAIADDACRLAIVGRGLTVLQRGSRADPWHAIASIDLLPGGGTGEALSWSPDGALLAYTGARRAHVFDTRLRELHQEHLV